MAAESYAVSEYNVTLVRRLFLIFTSSIQFVNNLYRIYWQLQFTKSTSFVLLHSSIVLEILIVFV